MKKHNIFLLFTSLTALLFCACSSELKEKENASSKPGTVTLSIANDTQRTISPASGISYKDVSKWTVTFEDITESRTEKYNDIVKTVSFSESANQQIQLPLGTYNVTLNGTANNATSGETATTQPVPFYGESTVTVEDGKSASISVFVAPKKSDGGKGSFNFTVTTSGEFGNYTPVVSGNYFTVSLTPYGGKNPVAAWTPTEISRSASVTEAGSTYSFSVSSGTPESIPSGFYTLSIKYTWVVGDDSDGKPLTKDKEIYYPYHDFLVEIVDGLETKGSADITVSLEDSKTYYATKGETIGNGAFESMPKNLDELLVDINRTTISTANIYIVDEVLTDETSTSYPEIDVSKVNATGKTYCIYTKSEKTQEYNSTPCYTITGAAVEGDEPIIDINSSVRTVTLKNSLSSSGISGRAKIVSAGRPGFVLKDNTSVFIDLTDENNQIAGTTICMPLGSTTFDSYYVENPCVTVKNLSTTQTSFIVYVEQSLSNSYSVVTNSSDDETYKTTNFYIIPSYSAGLSAAEIPTYSLVATRDGVDVTTGALLYAGDTVVITATPEQGEFERDTTFAWFINGEQRDCTAQSYEITFGVNAEASNTIICLVGYKGGYATAGIELYAAEQTALLYTKYGLGYAKLADLNKTSQVTEVLNFDSYPISDFCIDTKTNDAYLIYTNNTTTLIRKATYNQHYKVADYTSNDAAPGLIKMGNDNNLYVRLDGEQEGNLLGIVTLSSDNSANKAVFSKISIPLESTESTESTEILSFCVDSNGIVYTTYKSGKNIILASFENKDNSLQKRNSKILATINDTVESNYLPENISSNITITDMHYEDGYIYLIVRDVFIDYTTPTDSVRSLGGVCKIKAEDLTLADSTNPLIGWADTQLVITKNESGENVYNYKHNEETQNYFYGPQKIIAIKPKEIVIADDGASIENSQMHQENRVVLFNLETNSITGVKTSPKEFYFSTSGGDIMDYQPNQ
ncbi:MAG: hypothetical protein SPE48_07180 [Treponema porcinum]|uniref:hypothetical protein n=1 Tax=Treponema porcinum TaxID=261392 RepID=UPI002A8187E8|nr:hypothetical protein [Treponema porcinum]MDY5121673.1 hypothetical protein [Treponema porcinum]